MTAPKGLQCVVAWANELVTSKGGITFRNYIQSYEIEVESEGKLRGAREQ